MSEQLLLVGERKSDIMRYKGWDLGEVGERASRLSNSAWRNWCFVHWITCGSASVESLAILYISFVQFIKAALLRVFSRALCRPTFKPQVTAFTAINPASSTKVLKYVHR